MRLPSPVRLPTCIFWEEGAQCWIHFEKTEEFDAATRVLTALEVVWNRDPDEESSNIRVSLPATATKKVLAPWVDLLNLSRGKRTAGT